MSLGLSLRGSLSTGPVWGNRAPKGSSTEWRPNHTPWIVEHRGAGQGNRCPAIYCIAGPFGCEVVRERGKGACHCAMSTTTRRKRVCVLVREGDAMRGGGAQSERESAKKGVC